MLVRFHSYPDSIVDMHCKSVWIQCGFICIKLDDDRTWMVPAHLIQSEVEVIDDAPIRGKREEST